MKQLIIFALLSLTLATACKKNKEESIEEITSDLNLTDGKTYIINSDISNVNGSISLGGETTLIIENCTLNFDLIEDLQHGFYLTGNSKIIIKNATIKSLNKMWEFELRENASIEVTDSYLKNHSAVKLFDNCKLDGKNSLIEELRMDNKGVAVIDNCEIYPNMQFFFNVGTPLEFPDSYTKVDFVIDNSSLGGWKLDMKQSTAQGWQVDVKPNTNVTIQNSIDVTLALWSNGTVNDSIHIENPSGSVTDFSITELGSTVNIINTEVFFINLYLVGNDKLTISGDKTGAVYNAKFLEIVLLENSELTIYDSHIFGQLFHANDNSIVNIHNCLIGSDDPNDPINSEFGIKDDAHAYAYDCDLTNSDIVIETGSILEVTNCTYNNARVFTTGNGQLIIH